MPTIVMDLDGTLTVAKEGVAYPDLMPNDAVVSRLREYRERGYKIAIYTARNMRTHNQSLGKINAQTIPVILDWLNLHHIPFDELYVGKPWAEDGGFYVDDRAIRPDEFVSLSHEEITAITGAALQ